VTIEAHLATTLVEATAGGTSGRRFPAGSSGWARFESATGCDLQFDVPDEDDSTRGTSYWASFGVDDVQVQRISQDELVSRWLAHHRDGLYANAWVEDFVSDVYLGLRGATFDELWSLLERMVALANDNEDLVWIGVGPIYELVGRGHSDLLDRCRRAASGSRDFRIALAHAYFIPPEYKALCQDIYDEGAREAEEQG
jgi:hypothetical protein